MIETGQLKALVQEIMSHGHDRDTAGRYAVILGDTPVYDEQGNVLVIDNGEVLATLPPLTFYME